MAHRSPRRPAALLLGMMLSIAGALPANAYLFWTPPRVAGAPSTGSEPGLGVSLPGATSKEAEANLLWGMRAGLNVAALQCQFAPALMTVGNYNAMLRQHSAELQAAYTTVSGYFKRTGGKNWQTLLDQYTTRTYNSFSTMHAQLTFCETAAAIGRDTLNKPRGKLGAIALARMREFRNSLIPAGDDAFSVRTQLVGGVGASDLGAPQCTDRKGRPKPCKG